MGCKVILRRFGVRGAGGSADHRIFPEVYDVLPMTDYVSSNTKRYYLDYEGAMGKRTMQFRTSDAVSDAAASTEIARFVNAIKGILHNTVHCNGLRVALKGSNVSNPVAGWTDIVGTSAAAFTGEVWPRYFSYVGRSVDGSRIRLSVYGANFSVDADYRVLPGDVAAIGAGLAVLQTLPATFVTISSGAPIWKAYANAGYNAYHQRKRRAVG